MTPRATLADAMAQLGRRWIIVAGGALLGVVVGVAVAEGLDGRSDRGLTTLAALLILVALILVGGSAGLAAGLVLTRLNPRVTTADDVRRVTGLPVVAQLPPGVADAEDLESRPASRRMRSALREAVMNVRSLAGGEIPERIVLARAEDVGEACGVDGGLARALLESGFAPAVVLTDFDSQLLTRPSTVDDTALDAGLYPDASGYQRVPVPDRIASARPENRLGEVENFYSSLGERYDTAIALVGSNSHPLPLRGLAPLSDAIVLVVRSNRTSVEDLLAIHGELLGLGVEPLGVIMTGVAGRHRISLRRDWVPADFREGSRAGARPVDRVGIAAPFTIEPGRAGAQAPRVGPADPHPPAAPRLSIADLAVRAAGDRNRASNDSRGDNE